MITKEKVLEQIRFARLNHKRWMNYAKAIYLGLPVKEDAAPLFDTDCQFGKWYHGEGQVFRGMPSFDKIDDFHHALHEVYMNFFKTWKESTQPKWFESKKAVETRRNKKMKELLDQLSEISRLLIEQLDQFERDIKSLNEWEFKQALAN